MPETGQARLRRVGGPIALDKQPEGIQAMLLGAHASVALGHIKLILGVVILSATSTARALSSELIASSHRCLAMETRPSRYWA